MNTNIKLRIAGLFFGQLVGDAFGTRYEFKKSGHCIEKLKHDCLDGVPRILGGGPFDLYEGQYTDDSELALGIWYSILEKNEYDIEHIVQQFYAWYNSSPFDIGNATRTAFDTGTTRKDMLSNAQSNGCSLSNGCLMKISPIGALCVLSASPINTNKIAKEVCELTNPHNICVEMSICYVRAIECAIKTGDNHSAYKIACNYAQTQIVKTILEDSYYRAFPVKLLNSNNEITEVSPDGPFQGYIGIAFQNAFYNLLHAKSFDDLLLNTISLGGDADTNACIAGALYGACFGGHNIRKELLDSVMNFKNDHHRTLMYPPLNHQEIYAKLKAKLRKL